MGILLPVSSATSAVAAAPPAKPPAPSALMGPPVAFPLPGRTLYGAPRDGLPVARPTAAPAGAPPPPVSARAATLKSSQEPPLSPVNVPKPLPAPLVAPRPLSPRSQQQQAVAQSPPHLPPSPMPPSTPQQQQQQAPPLLRPRGDTQFSPMVAAAPSMTPVRAVSAASPAAESHYSTVPRQESFSGELWFIAPDEISVGEVVGRGNFGVVLRGEWRGMQVAVKQMVINADALSSQQRADFKRECAVLKQVRPHRNVVQFLGLTRIDGHDAIVLDFCGGGSLESALLDPAGGGCEWQLADKLAIAHDCGAGLTHLHREGIVHRDIAARNVLLDSFPFVAKLSDFGMSRQLQDAAADAFTATRIGPARWSSPEMIEKGSVSTRSDVFMFAVLLFEIFERAKPWAAFDPTAAAFEVLAGRRMQLSANTPKPMAELMYACWAHDPMQRPRMEDVLGQVKAAWLQVHADT